MELYFHILLKYLLYYIIFFSAYTKSICLNSKKPFSTQGLLNFCDQYSNLGCCDETEDKDIKRQFHRIKSEIGKKQFSNCRNIIKEILCIRCSPNYPNLINNNSADAKSGLCSHHCTAIYDNCKKFFPLLSKDELLSNLIKKEQPYCKTDNDQNDPCFPEQMDETKSTKIMKHDSCLCYQQISENLRNPNILVGFPDSNRKLLIAEQIGTINIHFTNDSKTNHLFLDITDRVLSSKWRSDTRGLLGFALHPNFVSNGRAYVYYCVKEGTSQIVRLSEFVVDEKHKDRLDQNSEKILFEVSQPFTSQNNGGNILFGLDGHLYVPVGDGGTVRKEINKNSQNKNSFSGKVLRFNVDEDKQTEPEIFAYGIHNFKGCDLDEGDINTGNNAGRIMCADNGLKSDDGFEEINILEKNGNYGWNIKNGNKCTNEEELCDVENEKLPIFSFNHTIAKSVVGGHIYRGCLNPNLQGKYFFADQVLGKIFYLKEKHRSTEWSFHHISTCDPDLCSKNGLTDKIENRILAFGEDADGEIYVLTTKSHIASSPDGKVFRIIDPTNAGDKKLCRTYKEVKTISDEVEISDKEVEISDDGEDISDGEEEISDNRVDISNNEVDISDNEVSQKVQIETSPKMSTISTTTVQTKPSVIIENIPSDKEERSEDADKKVGDGETKQHENYRTGDNEEISEDTDKIVGDSETKQEEKTRSVNNQGLASCERVHVSILFCLVLFIYV